MYSYCFEYYKPGTKFHDGKEIVGVIELLREGGFTVFPMSSHDPHFKGGKFIIEEKEENLSLNLEKSGQLLGFHLHPAQEEIHGVIGGLFMPEEQFRESPKEKARLMLDANMAICLGLRPFFAWGDHELELDKLSHFLRFDRIGALAWVNYFSRELVEQLGGPDRVLLRPEKDRELYQGTELGYAIVGTSPLPTEPMPASIALECERRYPGALLRSFEIPAVKAIERLS